MKLHLYNLLVNRHSGIRKRYHQFHDHAVGIRRYVSWLYLIALNLGYYVLQLRGLGDDFEVPIYEEKKLITEQTESQAAVARIPAVEEYIARASQYDVVSFDIFDTLIFRPFSEPTDLFFFVGEKLAFMDFKRIRVEAEQKARRRCYMDKGYYEVSLADIWKRMETETGIEAARGMQVEQELEQQFCYANPFMKQVFDKLIALDKNVIIISDMYLPKECLEHILKEQGFKGYRKLYVSGEYGCNKASGALYSLVQKDLNQGHKKNSYIHIGDNPISDVQMAEKAGWHVMPYTNINKHVADYRAYDMSAIVGGAYRGLVQNHIWSGLRVYTMEYEYGYIYGGIFAVGYCQFIHDYVRKNQVDKVLFLSRDGDILMRVYQMLYPEARAEYVYWSRRAATKLMAVHDKYDYFRRFVYHKVNQGYCLDKVLDSMELGELKQLVLSEMSQMLSASKSSEIEKKILTDTNASLLVETLQKYWTEILAVYDVQHQAAMQYYRDILKDCRRVAAIDIGWAGSGAMALRYLVEEHWKLPCEIFGIVAGTNTLYNMEPDACESFLQSGKLISYMFSQANNRDLLKKHDLNKDYNIYWELLLSSPTRQFRGFRLNEERKTELIFGDYDQNLEGIRQVQQGILDFAGDYMKHFGNIPWMLKISGRDAYAPMLVAASNKEQYLKQVKKRFSLEVQVE